MATIQEYFTAEERPQLLRLVKDLNERLGAQLTCRDINTVHRLISRGISEAEARAMIVSGFANPVSKELPLEYAAEMNNLIKLEMEMG